MSPRTLLDRLALDSTAPGIRQLASVIGLGIALVTTWALPTVEIDDPLAVWTTVAAVAALSVAAAVVPWERLDPAWRYVIPVFTMFAFGLLRLGTGGPQSLFTSLIVLPLVWIAAEPGRRSIWVAAAATSLTLLMPQVFGTAAWTSDQAMRAVFTPMVFLVVAGIVNELSHRARVQVESAEALAAERQRSLELSRASERSLAAAAERLAGSEAFFLSVWRAIVHDMTVITELDGRIEAWGPGGEALLGRSRQSMTGQPLLQVVAEHSLEALDAAGAGGFDRLVARLRDCGRSGEAVELLRDDGTTLPARMTHAPRLDAAGRLAGHIFIAHDMTELNEAARLKDEFVGTVSHELRTPLSSILGYLELAKDDESGPLTDEQRHYLAVVERNAQRLLALVGDLLFVAQVDAGKLPLALERLDPNDVLRASAESALPAASGRSIEVRCEPSAEPLAIDGDERRVGQAIDNLVSNAVKFTPADGIVRLGSALDGDEVVITVSDTGMGIPADEMRLLFGRFFRATTATRQAVPGVGLGLNITRAIVTAHGGRLSASSTVGKGTTFELRFPAAPATEPARAP